MRLRETEVFQKAVSDIQHHTAHRREGSPLKVAIQTSGREMLVLFGWVALSAVVGYITVAYMVTHLRTFVGYSPQTALTIFVSALAVAAVAQVYFGRLAGRLGRRKFAMTISGALALLVIPTFLSLSISPVVATIALAVFASFQYAAMIVSGCAMVELFPVDVRSSASGLAYSLAFSLFGGTVPFVATWLAADYGPTAPALYAVIFAIAGFFIGWKALPEARSMDVTSSGDELGVSRSAATTTSPAS
jgi:MHS family proline/betaine transporter-like MFS transporter